MNKFVVFTVITGKEILYDHLLKQNIKLKEENIDYLLFTNNSDVKSDFFDVIYIDSELNDKDLSRDIKINTHKYVDKYDLSLYIDGNVLIKNKLSKIFENNKNEFAAYYLKGNSIDEGDYIIKHKYSTKDNVKNRLDMYKNDGFDISNSKRIYGKILMRKNSKTLENFNNQWYSEYQYVNRDQLALPYLITKLNIDIKIWGFWVQNEHFKKYFQVVRTNGKAHRHRRP